MDIRKQAHIVYESMLCDHTLLGTDTFAVALVPANALRQEQFDCLPMEVMENSEWYKHEHYRHVGTYHYKDASIEQLYDDIYDWCREHRGAR